MASKLLLLKEYKNLRGRPKSNYFQVYGLKEDNIHEWIVFIIGPPNTFYEGGIYKATLRFPATYPMDPPSLQFVCNFYHPNVYRDGKVCISTLQIPPRLAPNDPQYDSVNTAAHWRPVIGVEQALLSVVSLLSDPNHDDPANPAASQEWQQTPDSFKKKAQKIAVECKKLVPEDFVLPVVASSNSTSLLSSSSKAKNSNESTGGSSEKCVDHVNPSDNNNEMSESGNNQSKTETHCNDSDDGEEEEDYVYSDDEDDEDDDNDDDKADLVKESVLVNENSNESSNEIENEREAKHDDGIDIDVKEKLTNLSKEREKIVKRKLNELGEFNETDKKSKTTKLAE